MNKTKLKQGSLKGLRKQTNECLDAAYNKGFEDGKKENKANFSEEEINNIANKERQEGYDNGYNNALEDVSELMAYITQEFIDNCYPNEKGYNLYDLNAKYGLARILKDYKAYEKKKKAEKEIQVGDEIKSLYDEVFGVVTKVNSITGTIRVLFRDGSGATMDLKLRNFERTGRHFDELQQLLDKMKE